MPFRDVSKNSMLADEAARLTHCSIHTASPINTMNEISTRQPIAWATPTGGVLSKSAANPIFNVLGGNTVVAVGFGGATGEPRVEASVSGTYFGADGTLTLTRATLDLNA